MVDYNTEYDKPPRVVNMAGVINSFPTSVSVGTRSATKDITWCDVLSGRGKEAQRMLMMSTSERYKRLFTKDLQFGSKEMVLTILISTEFNIVAPLY